MNSDLKLKPQAFRDWNQEDAFLSEIFETQSDVAAVELDTPIIMRLVAERTRKLTGADGASVQLVDGDHLTCRAVTGLMEDFLGLRLSLTDSLSGHALREGRALYCEDSETDDRVDLNICRTSGARSMICAPLFRAGEAVGVLNVVSVKPNAFEPRHLAALRLMGGVVAAALHHSSEFEIKKRLLGERTHALAALRESEERFRGSFEHAAIGMAVVALDGRWMEVNRSLCDIVGYSEAELLVTNFQSITHPDDLDTDLNYVRQLIAGKIRNYHMTKRYFHKHGHVVWIMLSVSMVRDDAGKPLYFISQIQDISERKRTEDALRVSEEAYRTTFEMAGVGMAHTDLGTGRFLRVNRKLCNITGYSADELKCLTFYQITHPDDIETNRDAVRRMLAGTSEEFVAEKRYIRKDGRTVWVALNATPVRGIDGQPLYSVAMSKDITAQKLGEWLERDRREVLELVAGDQPVNEVFARLVALIERQVDGHAAVLLLDGGAIELHGSGLPGGIADAIRRAPLRLAAALSESCAADCVGITDLVHAADLGEASVIALAHGYRTCLALPLRSAEGVSMGMLLAFCRAARGATEAEKHLLHMAGKLAAISIEHHQSANMLAHAVRHDPLTGLPNRILFDDRLQQALGSARRGGKIVAVFAMDLDRFKEVNDTLGHQAGDELLQQFAHRVKSLLRETDTLARMGGDEFVLLLPEMTSGGGATRVAKMIVAALAEPFELGGKSAYVTGSVGIALFPRDGGDSQTLLQAADAAMYQAKRGGRNGFVEAG